ncbi:MAG TPA: AAA family ATPase, partial [Patescibacteria group bacterium]|nr:AAA family ATPase [Patescibacteria group bacterium]
FPSSAIFLGPKGVGKRTIASCIMLSAQVGDVMEVVPGSEQMDQARSISSFLSLKSSRANSQKFVLLDNADELSEPAQNVLLKVLEELRPRTHVIFICHSSQLLETITSRSWQYFFGRLSEEDMQAFTHQNSLQVLPATYQAAAGSPGELLRLASEHDTLAAATAIVHSETSRQKWDLFFELAELDSDVLAQIFSVALRIVKPAMYTRVRAAGRGLEQNFNKKLVLQKLLLT